MKYLILVIALFCGSVEADNSYFSIKTLKATANTLLVIDWAQTHAIKNSDKHYETNQFLGDNPSKPKINLYFAAALLLNQFGTNHGSSAFQQLVQYGVISIEATYAFGNASMGFKVYN